VSKNNPHTTTCCDTCDSREWSTLADCDDCGNAMCDMCPGAENIGTGNDLLCGACVELRRLQVIEDATYNAAGPQCMNCESTTDHLYPTPSDAAFMVCDECMGEAVKVEREEEIVRIQARLSVLLAQRKVA